ncbi:MAG: sigma factor [Phycisphaerales bacterium]
MELSRTTTTTALLDALTASNDDVVWGDFVARYRPVLAGIGRRLGLGEADAHDIAQQTLFEFVRDLRSGRYARERGRLRSWLLAIAEHRTRDLQRRMARREDDLGSSIHEIPARAELVRLWTEEKRRSLLGLALERLRQGGTEKRTIQAFELVALRNVAPEQAAIECEMNVEQVYVAKNRVTMRLRSIVTELEALYDDEEKDES